MTTVLRNGILATAERDEVERFIRTSPWSRALVARFVAGDRLEDALMAASRLAAQGLTTTLDRLGENVLTQTEARTAVESYAETLRQMAASNLDPNISVKLTMLGLDIGDEVAYDNMLVLLETARSVDGFVRIDMEGSAYTERTLAIAEALHARFPRAGGDGHPGLSPPIRSRPRAPDRPEDAGPARERRVRGTGESRLAATAEINEAFIRLMERLLEAGRFPAIATHDPALVRATQGFALRMGIDPARWEFQMLYGVRREAQLALAREGYGMRIYVPFGADWYPYFARRIAERPANMLFVLRQLITR